jgi:YVTN family beta-propeller protein
MAAGLPLLAGLALQACGSSGGDEAWVANYSFTSQPGTSIAAINLDAAAADGMVTTASLPTGIAATPDGSEVVVTNRGNNSISVIGASSHDVSATWTVGLEPDALAVTTQGGAALAVVANFGANSVSIIDLGNGNVRATVAVGVQPDAVAIAPGGTRGAGMALVANYSSGSLSEIDLGNDAVVATIHTAPEPDAIAVDPAPGGTLALVTGFLDDTVTTIDLSTGAATPSALALNPTDAVWDPTRSVAWISGGSGLASFSPSSGAVGRPITMPAVAEAVALGAGSKIAWVALQNGSVVPVTLDTESVGRQIKIGGRPSAIVVTH